MTQGKLDEVKQEMARVNLNILGTTELKQECENLTQMTTISSTVDKNPLEDTEYPSQSTKESKRAVLGCSFKNDRMISLRFKDKPLNITVIQVYTPASDAEEAEIEWFYEGQHDLLELTPSNRQVWPQSTK